MAKTKLPIALFLILLLGSVIRLVNLNQSFWLDEASQAQMSSESLSWIWSARINDFHPPLYYIFSHYWLLLGNSEIWLRLPSVIFGVLNVYLIFLFANHLYPAKKINFGNWGMSLGLCTALLLAVNPFHVYYSQEFRSYALLCLLGTWSMYLLSSRSFFWLAVANALLIYTHYSSVFLIITQLVFVIIYTRQDLKRFLLSGLFSLIAYLPWIPQLVTQINSGININNYLPGWSQILSASAVKTVPLTLFKLVAGRITFLSKIVYYPYIVFVLGITLLSFRFITTHRKFLITWAITPVLLMILTSFVFPQNQPFRVIYIIPALVLVFSQAILRFPKLFLTFLIYIALVGNLSYFTRPRLQREQWRQALFTIQGLQTPSSISLVKFSAPFSPMSWYLPNLAVFPAISKFPAQPQDVSEKLAFLSSSQINHIFLFEYLTDLTDPHREVDLGLANLGFVRTKIHNFEGVGFIHEFNRI